MSTTAGRDAVIRGADLSHKVSATDPLGSGVPAAVLRATTTLNSAPTAHAASGKQPSQHNPYRKAPPHTATTLHASRRFHQMPPVWNLFGSWHVV